VRVLLDSDIVIEVLRARDHGILTQWSALRASDAEIMFTPVTAAEVWEGARPGEHKSIGQLFSLLDCAEMDCGTGRLAGDLLRSFRGSHNLQIADSLIAAAAIQHRAALWTRNRKHYPMPQLVFYA
jgi:predicted nucleic acid-binding protein